MYRSIVLALAITAAPALAAPVNPPSLTNFTGIGFDLSADPDPAESVDFLPDIADPANCPYGTGQIGLILCARLASAIKGLGPLDIQYQGGDADLRIAEVVPFGTSNYALRFAIFDENVSEGCSSSPIPCKGRVQMRAYGMDHLTQLYYSVYMYLPADDFNALKQYQQAFAWLTISEWWNNPGWTGAPYPFRISVDIAKPSATQGSALVLRAKGQKLVGSQFTDVWTPYVSTYELPLGQWLKLEYYFVEGNDESGRLYLAVTPPGGERVVVFDIHETTHHPDNRSPDGLTHLNPIKLYTSEAVISHMQLQSATLQIYWDNLEFRTCKAPDEGTPEIRCKPNHIP